MDLHFRLDNELMLNFFYWKKTTKNLTGKSWREFFFIVCPRSRRRFPLQPPGTLVLWWCFRRSLNWFRVGWISTPNSNGGQTGKNHIGSLRGWRLLVSWNTILVTPATSRQHGTGGFKMAHHGAPSLNPQQHHGNMVPGGLRGVSWCPVSGTGDVIFPVQV